MDRKIDHSLADTHPHIACEAHGWNPTEVTAVSQKKREWKCKSGDVYSASPNHRAKGFGCPYDSGRIIRPLGFSSLTSIHPDVAKLALDWDTSEDDK